MDQDPPSMCRCTCHNSYLDKNYVPPKCYCYCSIKKDVKTNSWISVKDQLPMHDQFVLSHKRQIFRPFVLRFFIDDDQYYFMWPDLKGQVLNITYWMPLPEPPNE